MDMGYDGSKDNIEYFRRNSSIWTPIWFILEHYER